MCSGLDRSEALLMLLTPITAESTLLNGETPQGQAFEWLDGMDTETDPCSYPTLEQRYALATMYYSTNGDDWRNNQEWLSAAPECDWYKITCNEDGQVVAINLGTYPKGECRLHPLQTGTLLL
jgi:hypothetical protein